jgi:hypothetical protein
LYVNQKTVLDLQPDRAFHIAASHVEFSDKEFDWGFQSYDAVCETSLSAISTAIRCSPALQSGFINPKLPGVG